MAQEQGREAKASRPEPIPALGSKRWVAWNPGTKLEIWMGHAWQSLEEMPAADWPHALYLLSAVQLRSECDRITARCNSYAYLGHYDSARRLAVIADAMEEFIKNGGEKHR